MLGTSAGHQVPHRADQPVLLGQMADPQRLARRRSIKADALNLFGAGVMTVACLGAAGLGDGAHFQPVAEQHDRDQRGQLFPERHARIAEGDGCAEAERDRDRQTDQRHHSRRPVAQLAREALDVQVDRRGDPIEQRPAGRGYHRERRAAGRGKQIAFERRQ